MNGENDEWETSKRATVTLVVVVRCAQRIERRARYVFDSLFAAAGVKPVYQAHPPSSGVWILYADRKSPEDSGPACLAIAHVPSSWEVFDRPTNTVAAATRIIGLEVVLERRAAGFDDPCDVDFDIVANAFYFLSSWAERSAESGSAGSRALYKQSIFSRLGLAQDVVDRYLRHLVEALNRLITTLGGDPLPSPLWPENRRFAIVLSHDIDYLPSGRLDVLRQGAKSVLRHLLRHRAPGDAVRALVGLSRALARGRDPYGCVPEIIAAERQRGVRSSFQVAVAHRHANDVDYRVEDDSVRDYLRAITDAGFDLCLHGSYRSSESTDWYVSEVDLLAQRLARPQGSRQHYLSFDYDRLFAAQEIAGIRYDMSMGYPDRPGPRAGFSFPYFPYCISEDRPYDVLQISLFLMDVTLRGYMELQPLRAWTEIEKAVDDLHAKGGCASVVWHPIVFGGARDPGYDQLYWRLIEHVQRRGGLATDGRTIDGHWRQRCRGYASFSGTPKASHLASTKGAAWQTC